MNTDNDSSPTFHRDGSKATPGWVFVFGSNLAGRHGAGSAKAAKLDFGAVYGRGVGRTGDAYAIPTKDGRRGADLKDPRQKLGLDEVRRHVDDFIAYAAEHPELSFFVTRVGCGLAGHKDEEIGPMFAGAPKNCSLPHEWKPYVLARTVLPLAELNNEATS